MALYKYQPLQTKRHIRLLKVPKATNTILQDLSLRIHLEHVFLDDASLQAYEPVSYTWTYIKAKTYIRYNYSDDESESDSEDHGTKSRSPAITVANRDRSILNSSGQLLTVSESLIEALPYLAATSVTGYLWIDQLCINQDDPTEREEQVSIMHEIYSGGLRTLIWLGEDTEDTAYIQAVITAMGSNSQQYQVRRGNEFYFENVNDLYESLLKEPYNGDNDLFKLHLESALYGFFSRPWVSALTHQLSGELN
jgi:hypothetical protein